MTYQQQLENHLVKTILIGLGASIVCALSALDLHSFVQNGIAFLHPYLAAFLCLAAGLLTVVSVFSACITVATLCDL